MELSPVKTTLRIALVGDYNPDVIAHQAIPLAIDDAAAVLELTADYDWLATPELTSPEDLVGYDAIWLVPASPYKNTEAAFIAARYARENSIPFLGTCGGFQHALIEYARNVLGWHDAGHAETDTDTEGRMVIAPLTCSLVEKTDAIELRNNTLIAKAYGKPEIQEGYHCNYGVSPEFADQLERGDMRVTGWDEQGEIRAAELVTHPFFVLTLFQHERAALQGRPVVLVQAMMRAAQG
ncbi:TPA: CTP synthase [Enterobacter hormaechei subsp. steigerwaltii]|uniref:CTP synthase C-terminal region-related (seleno)protein n=1 Tax=Enterobacter cloacae complex TaxID=354276 RepID=UPI00187731CF|nr:CTP synthase [Enterobacter cloacae complex sp. P18RS]MBE4986630.1 CTP synthase [Enterobacter cloacae complex sp. P18RS]HAV1869718.1 CTP synthase [Enterobacter hormaechei subsp. steigerwaltii]